MILSLIVKGDKLTAAREASKRGVPFAFIREVRRHGTCETVGKVGSQHRETVAAWFQEGTRVAPFPAGTLLLYTELEKE
jgi:hypothetical protein